VASWSSPTAGALGLFELVVGAGTLLVVRWESAAACTATYLAFGLIMRRARRLGADGDCGCFGSLPSRIDDFAVLRNIGLGLAALAIAFGRGLSLLPNYEVSTAIAAAVLLLVGGAALDTLVFVRGRERG
jgi:methylamine utilization protein MauE